MFKQLLLLLSFFFLIETDNTVKIYLTVDENQKPSGPIGNIINLIKNQTKVTENYNSKLFRLEKDKPIGHRNYINLDESGNIWIQSPIDREEICQQNEKCIDGANLKYLIIAGDKVIDLQIEVVDINDNYPTFQPDESTLKIQEGTSKWTEYSLPVAKDKDSDKYGIKNYELKPINSNSYEKYFDLKMNSNNNPSLRVIGELDRETTKEFEFYLYASDHGGYKGKCKIIVEITDVNDNTPQWIGLPYRKEIPECTSDIKVLKLNAQDKDDPQTSGGQVRFKISENSPNYDIIMRAFYITENILYINNGALKSFGQSKASIIVIATDGARSNETTVEIDIKDCNDHRPGIQIHDSNLKINENVKNKTLVTSITVSDEDKGMNSEFSCSLNDTSFMTLDMIYESPISSSTKKKVFQLNTIPGVSFDRERYTRHSLEMLCTDNGSPVMSNTETINIFIGDENDNAPKFESPYKTFSISEDSKIGSEVGQVTASDIDLSPNNMISYAIEGDSQIRQIFSIDNYGKILLNKGIDREEKERYEFIVTAKDNGKPKLSDSCTIQVTVLDVNDNAPEIAKEHYFRIVESINQEQKYETVGKLNASDKDSGANGTFKFKLVPLGSRTLLQLTNDGRLFIHGVIDREKVDKIVEQIEVFDNGYPSRTTTTTIHIEILDLNDNKPKFIFPKSNYPSTVNISLDTPVGQSIVKVEASDPDNEVNGTINYTLLESDSSKSYFTIHPDGHIMLNKKLDEKMKNTHILKVQASDNGTPPLKETSYLYVHLTRKHKDISDSVIDNSQDSTHMDPKESFPKKGRSISPNTLLLGFLIVAILLILIIIAGIAAYIYCRGQGGQRMGENGKHIQTIRDPNSAVYQKGCSKNISKSESSINNEVILRNENYNQVGISMYTPSYTNLYTLKNKCYPPDNSYHFGQPLLTDNYSAFQPKLNTLSPDKETQEFNSFIPDDTWNPPKPVLTNPNRKKNFSESSDNIYDSDHKYASIHPSNLNNYDMDHELNNVTHFTSPSQNRRSDLIQSRPDTSSKLKVNLVNSSFV